MSPAMPALATLALACCSTQPRHIDALLRRLPRAPRVHHRAVVDTLSTLTTHGLVQRDGDHYCLTDRGIAETRRLGVGT